MTKKIFQDASASLAPDYFEMRHFRQFFVHFQNFLRKVCMQKAVLHITGTSLIITFLQRHPLKKDRKNASVYFLKHLQQIRKCTFLRREALLASHENPFYFTFFPRHQYFDRYYLWQGMLEQLHILDRGTPAKQLPQAVLQIFNRLLHDRCRLYSALILTLLSGRMINRVSSSWEKSWQVVMVKIGFHF